VRAAVSALAVWGTLAAIGPRAAAQDARALPILEAAAGRYAKADTLCADFVQHLSVPLLGEDRTGRGRLCQAQPDRFAMRFTEPPGDAVVVDGTSVWVYYPSLDPKQVMKFPMSSSPGGYDFHREFLTDPASRYTLTYEARESVGGHACHRIRLVPRAEASYRAAVLWVDAADSLVRQVRVEDENGSVRTLTLNTVELAPTVPAGWFTFTPPAGAQVITPLPGTG
jgi:outer membrane lipoprotein carrier protein